MSKRQRKHNHVVSSVLAAALAFTAIVSSVQLASVSDDLAANVGGRYVADATCPDGSPMPAGGMCPVAGDGGGGTIPCNSLNGQQVTTAVCGDADSRKAACQSPSTWDGNGSGTCIASGSGTGGSTTNVTCPNGSVHTSPYTCTPQENCATGTTWNGISCTTGGAVGGGASSYVTQPTCTEHAYFWSSTKNMCYSTQLEKTNAESGGTTANQTCSGATPFKWGDGSCHASVETVGGGASSYVTQSTCTEHAYFWSPTKNMCYSTQLEKTNAESGGTTTNQTCSGATPFKWGDGSCHASVETVVGTQCGQDQVWDFATKACKTQSAANCPQGQYYNGISCATSTDSASTACGYNQYFDGTACVQYTAPTQPATFQDFFAGPQCSKTASHIDPYCFGINQWNDKAGCQAAGYMWDSGRSDCFPGFGTQVGPMMPPPMPFGGKMIPGVAPSMTQSAGADFTQWMKVSGTEGQTQDYCSTTTGRNDPGCAYQRLKGTESTTDMYSMIKAQAQTFGTGTGPNAADFEAYREVEQMFDRMRFETGGAYCPEMEQLGKVLYEAETNEDLAMIEAVAADSDTYIKQLQGCGGVNRFNELTDLRSKVEALADSEGKEDLLAKIDAVSADSSALENPRTMGDLWKAYGMLQHKFKQERSEEGPCNSIERTKGDIEAYLSGEHDVEFGGEAPSQEIVEGVLENIETTLAEANKVGGPEGKKMCKRMKEELKKMEKQYFGDQGVLYNPMEEYMMNLYGDFDYIDSQTAMYEGMEGVNLDEIKAFIQQMIMEQFAKMKDEIIATIRAEIKTALANVIDFEALILENSTLSGATTAVADATEGLSEISRKAEEIQQNATQELAANLEQLPPELVEAIYDRQETVLTEFFQPILTADPAVLEEVKVPLENLLATFVSQPLPEEIVAELTSYDLVGTISNAIEASGVVNDEGTYIISDEDDVAVVVKILEDVLTEAQEIVEPERLEAAQVEEGLRPDNADFDPEAWWGTAAMGRVADGSTKGEGDGSLNPGGILLKAHVAVQMDRALEGDASTSLLGDQAGGMDTWMQEGAALALEAGTVDGSRVAQEMAEPATRGDAIFMMARILANENSEVEDMINELPCTLDDDDLADTDCNMEHAAEINFAVNAGIVRGNEDADGTLSFNADSNVLRGESWVMQGRMETFLTEVEAVGGEEMLARMGGDASIGDVVGN